MQTLTPSEADASDLTGVKSIDKRAIEAPMLRGDETIPTGQDEEPSVLNRVLTSPGDTVGGTTYDWWLNGPALRRICYNLSTGTIHLIWLHSRECADCHVFYNYYDGTRWVYNKHDFMESGIPVTIDGLRGGCYGTIDVDYSTDIEFISNHASEGGVYYSWVCYDPWGTGFYVCNHCPTPIGICDEGIIWPRLALGPSGYVHICACSYEDMNRIFHCYSTDGGDTFSPWVYMATTGFPSHNIAASQNSSKVCVVWSVADGDDDGVVYYKESTDGGTTWGDSVDISSDIPSDLRHAWILGGYPVYDSDDNLHIATQTSDGEHIAPAEVWHWCEANSPEWGLVASYPELWELAGTPGYNALCADRPSIGMDPTTGYLYCVWEEFPWDDAEPVTGRANAEIYAARSMDNGVTWGNKVNLTNTFGETERYPSLAPVVNCTLHIEYLADLVAGQAVMGEGDCTDNPVLYLAVSVIEGDVAALSIDNPTEDDPLVPGDTCYPKATVSNLGSNEVTFQARLSAVIKGMEFYYDIKEVTLGGEEDVQIEFDPWLVDSLVGDTVVFEGEPPDTVVLDTLIITCYASLLGDTDLSNDNVSEVFTGVEEIPAGGELPKVFTLSQNYPNPFNPITKIRYDLPVDCKVRLEIYNILGQKVATLVDKVQKAGYKPVHWDSRNITGREVSSGIYIYRLQAGDFTKTRKMVLLK